MQEILRFVITGGVSFVVEFILLVVLRDTAGLPTLLANAIAFTVSVIVNYFLCLLWVFQGAQGGSRGKQAVFFLTSLIGLALNELIMFVLGAVLGEDTVLFSFARRAVSMYMVNKVIATLLVMVWNYFSKRAVLTHSKS
ncbi:MAG: GtrA family protein [Clostridia bacterium]|nr:GtrA family protein [Clostridia bacterium]